MSCQDPALTKGQDLGSALLEPVPTTEAPAATQLGEPVHGQPQIILAVPAEYPNQDESLYGRWRDSVCKCCCECDSMCLAWCCPCFSFANTLSQTRLGDYKKGLLMYLLIVVVMGLTNSIARSQQSCIKCQGSSWDDDINCGADNDDFHGNYTFRCTMTPLGHTASLIGSALALVLVYMVMNLRTKFRLLFQIPGSCCEDCLCAWFCHCCTLAQMDRHLATTKTAGSCVFADPGPSPSLPQGGFVAQQPIYAQQAYIAQPAGQPVMFAQQRSPVAPAATLDAVAATKTAASV